MMQEKIDISPELKWQKLNAKLRVIIIILLVALAVAVVLRGSSPCNRCKICDSRTGNVFDEGKTEPVCVTCQEIMLHYAEIETNKSINSNDPRYDAVADALRDKKFNVST